MLTAAEWLDAFKAASLNCDQVQNLLHEKQQREKEHLSSARVKSQIRKKLGSVKDEYSMLEKALEQMEAVPQDFHIGRGEIGRRRGMLSNMDSQIRSFQDMLENRRRNPRSELQGLASERSLPQETEQTMTMTNQQFYDDHQVRMQAQDGQLDEILTGVSRLRNMGEDIGDELSVQHGLLEDLDHSMDRVDYHLQDNTDATNALMKKNKAGCGLWIIVLLFIVIVVVSFV